MWLIIRLLIRLLWRAQLLAMFLQYGFNHTTLEVHSHESVCVCAEQLRGEKIQHRSYSYHSQFFVFVLFNKNKKASTLLLNHSLRPQLYLTQSVHPTLCPRVAHNNVTPAIPLATHGSTTVDLFFPFLPVQNKWGESSTQCATHTSGRTAHARRS